jgi:hypothetical protein
MGALRGWVSSKRPMILVKITNGAAIPLGRGGAVARAHGGTDVTARAATGGTAGAPGLWRP